MVIPDKSIVQSLITLKPEMYNQIDNTTLDDYVNNQLAELLCDYVKRKMIRRATEKNSFGEYEIRARVYVFTDDQLQALIREVREDETMMNILCKGEYK